MASRSPSDPPAPHHAPEGGFRNPWPDARPAGFGSLLLWGGSRLFQARRSRLRPGELSAEVPAFATPRAGADEVSFTWVGHSTFLLQIGGYNVLTDPMWSERASPVSWTGPRRVMPPGVDLDALPPIDVVVVTHDHYDHLDDETVRALAPRHPDARWFVPLGLAEFCARRGVPHVTEYDWWDVGTYRGLDVTCTPAQHFSGRSVVRNRALWCGWCLRAGGRSVYFVGDTGYHPDFRRIGERCGPFHAVIAPIGAYEPRWVMRTVHLNPDEAVAAYDELVGGQSVPCPLVAMHWGTFPLTDEPLAEPPGRVTRAWRRAGHPDERLWVMAHGETRWLGDRDGGITAPSALPPPR